MLLYAIHGDTDVSVKMFPTWFLCPLTSWRYDEELELNCGDLLPN